MARRCLMGSGKFGIILVGADVGTLVTISSTHTFDDGRFLLRLKGESVFRVLERQGLDDYTIGRIEEIEYFTDQADEEQNERYKEELSSLCETLKQNSSITLDAAKVPTDAEAFITWFPTQIFLTAKQKQAVGAF